MQIGTMLYTGRREWKYRENVPTAAAVMLVPVVFALLLLVCAVVMLAVWLLSSWYVNHTLAPYTKLPQVRQAAPVIALTWPAHAVAAHIRVPGMALDWYTALHTV